MSTGPAPCGRTRKRGVGRAAVAFGIVLAAGPEVSDAVETAAHGAHLAWCLGLTEAAAADSAAARRLASALRTRRDELGLDPDPAAPAVDAGRQAAHAYAAKGQDRRLRDAMAGCRTSLATGAR